MFHRVDFNEDKSVSAKEMQRWIMEKTKEHFQEAVRENKLSFRAVDPDRDGEEEEGSTCGNGDRQPRSSQWRLNPYPH